MFITTEIYRDKVQEIAQNSKSLAIAIAFWGKDSESLFNKNSEALPIRIICNLLSGGTNPEPIKRLIDQPGVVVRHQTSLHAKVILGDKSALVGSANMSTNGLNNEMDENPGWQEAGFLTKDTNELNDISAWFEKQWKTSDEVTESDLEKAKQQWDARRINRITTSKVTNFRDIPKTDFKGRDISIVIWREDASKEAIQAFDEFKKSLDSVVDEETSSENLSFFESGENFPIETSLIGVYLGPRGAVRVEGPYKRIPELDTSFADKDGIERKIQIIVYKKTILNGKYKFDSAANKWLASIFREHAKKIVAKAESLGDESVISLFDALDAI